MTDQTAPGGIDLTIYSNDNPSGVSVPSRVFIDGREVYVPDGSSIDLSALSDREAPTVTLTMYVRNFALSSEVGPSDESK